jgi:hypothetical protein
MVLAPILLIAAIKTSEPGPLLPPGIDTNFQSAVLSVEDKLQAKDFKGAASGTAILPKRAFTIQWDDSKVPAGMRKEYASQRDRAINDWRGIAKVSVKIVASHPDVKFSFVDVLPNQPNSAIPTGATYFWSDTPGDVRLEAVLGLKRMNPAAAMNPINVRNEVATALGAYLGLGVQPTSNTIMGRVDTDSQYVFRPIAYEMLLSTNTLNISDELRLAVQKHKVLEPTRPKIFFDPASIDMGTTLQGDQPTFSVQLTNTGNAPLALRFTPDCQCVITDEHYQVVKPGNSYILKGGYNTMLTVGDIHHAILLNTNDVTQPTVVVPVHVIVKPRFQFIFPEGNVVKLPDEGTTVDVYLALSDDTIVPKQVSIAGVKGDATMEPWTGPLADPETGGAPSERHGYKISIHLTGELDVPGSTPATLFVSTGNPKFPTIQTTFYSQRGIVVSPGELYMGEVGPGPRQYVIQVSGPAHSFHVKNVKTDWPHLFFTTTPSSDGTQVLIRASYDGKGSQGPILGNVDVETDDPNQPLISIPIRGTILP